MANARFHVASGFSGYGPDASDGNWAYADDIETLCNVIREEMSHWIDFEYESAISLGDAKQYESAWNMIRNSDRLSTLAANLNPERKNAPLYANDWDKWSEDTSLVIANNFPMAVNEGKSTIYVWECSCDEDCSDSDD